MPATILKFSRPELIRLSNGMLFNQEQTDTVIEAVAHCRNRKRNPYVMHGLAGSGKTAALTGVYEGLNGQAHVATPTGKAASVISHRIKNSGARTLHSLFMERITEIDQRTGR